jgi:hypothetical protein
MAADRSDLRCTLTALLAAWVTMVFGASLLMAAFGPGPGPTGLQKLARAGWQGADDMGPAVKLLLIALFALLVLGGRRVEPQRAWQRLAVDAMLGAMAMLFTLALIPESFSRGFGVGLTGARFDSAVLPIYLCAGALGGIVFTLSRARCRSRQK